MNSAQWRQYPKPADFPRVGECHDCHGLGLRINPKWKPHSYRTYEPWPSTDYQGYYAECIPCGGTGRCIPAEWLNG